MSDLISREALIKLLKDYGHSGDDDYIVEAVNTIPRITNAPAINSLQNLETQGEAVTKLWESLGRWSAYLVSNGEQAELSPPAWLIDAVKNATTQQQPQSVADALEEAAKLLERQRFMALDITKTYTAEEHRQGLKSSVAFLAKKIRALIKRNAEGVE